MTGRSLAAVIGAAGGPPGSAAAIGPLGRYLTDPGAVTAHAARLLLDAARHQGPVAGPLLAAALTAALLGRAWLRRRQHAAFAARRPGDHGAGAAAGGPGRRGGAVGEPDRAAAPPVGPAVAWAAAYRVRVHLGGPGDDDPGVGPRDRAARHDRAGHRGRLARRPRRHHPRHPAAAAAGALVTGGTLRLARTEILPLKTDHGSDPLRALAAAGSGLTAGEHAIVQVLARPVTGARLRRARRAARRLRTGHPARRLNMGLPAREGARLLLDVLTPGSRGAARRGAASPDPGLAAEVRAAVIKSAGPQWDTQIRYATATTAIPAGQAAGRGTRRPQAQARARLRGLAHGLASATALYAGRNWLARRHLRHPAAQIAARRFRRGGLLSVPELAAIARLPADASLPGLARAGARAIAPPPAVPVPGPGVRPLGVTDTGVPRPVGIAVADARHHLRVIGPTGTGKTTLITGQILADAAGGPRGGVHRPQGRRGHRPARPPPRQRRGEGGAVRPGGPGGAAVPERAAGRRVRHRPRRDHRQRHRDLPPHLQPVLGTPHRRHLPRRVPHPPAVRPARLRPGHPRRHPQPAHPATPTATG